MARSAPTEGIISGSDLGGSVAEPPPLLDELFSKKASSLCACASCVGEEIWMPWRERQSLYAQTHSALEIGMTNESHRTALSLGGSLFGALSSWRGVDVCNIQEGSDAMLAFFSRVSI